MPIIIDLEDGALEANYAGEMRENIYFVRKTFRNTYIVIADTDVQREDDIALTNGLPRVGYPLRGCICTGVRCQEVQTVIHPVTHVRTTLWHVTTEFDSAVDEDQVRPDQNTDPVAQKPSYWWETEFIEEDFTNDVVTGDPIWTKAGEIVPITVPVPYPVLNITRIENHPFDPMIILLFVNHANLTPFWGAPEGSVQCLDITTNEERVGTKLYDRIHYKFLFKMKIQPDPEDPNNPAAWTFMSNTLQLKVLHQGYLYREPPVVPVFGPPIPGPIKTHLDANGNPTPVNLTTDGQILPPNQPPNYLTVNRLLKSDFNLLSLGPF